MRRKWWVLSAVACGTFMSTLDSSITNIALPTLVRNFDTDLVEIKWIVIAYLLSLTGFLLPFGRLSDWVGRRRVFALGFFVFTLGSVFCGLSTGFLHLVLARVFQGIGASILMANGPALITAAFPPQERGQALGLLSVVVSAGLISGPAVGGILLSQFGWQSIFWVNLPIGLLGMALTLGQFRSDTRPTPFARFDWLGSLLQLLMLSTYILLIDQPLFGQLFVGLPDLFPWVVGALLVIFTAVFVSRELNTPKPVIDFSLFRIRNFWTANVSSFLLMFSYATLTVLLPFYLQEGLSFSPREVGAWLSLIPIAILLVAPVSGRLSDRIGSRGLSFAGAMLLFVILAAMSLGFALDWDFERIRGQLALCLAGVGLALGLFQSPNNATLMNSVPRDQLGSASALVATFRNLGLLTGAGLGTNWMNLQLNKGHPFLQSLQETMLFAAFFAALAALSVLARHRHQPNGRAR